MAKKLEGRKFNVSVIGLSGTEREKGQFGVGKSCLCNRFIHQVADKYHTEHISVLSQSDFGGRVINNDHFLYWGEVTKTDDASNFTFHVIEQTEFIDDVSFSPFKTGRTDPYTKRCVQSKVQSAEKLMYICKDQLGMETDSVYEQKTMPDGKLNIDGILCCFDVSVVPDRTLEKQVDFCATLLNNAMKTKKPVVMVTTKNDSLNMDYVREAEKLINRKEYKNAIPLVETSAHENVNVENAFLLLAHMMVDKNKVRTKVMPFTEAMRARKEILDVAKDAFSSLLHRKVTDSRMNWAAARRKLEKESDYEHYVEMFGTDRARTVVRRHIKQLREDLIHKKKMGFLQRLPAILAHFLPDLHTIGDRPRWRSCQQQMMRDEDFDLHFVKVCEDDDSWVTTDFVDDVTDDRLPLDILYTQEAETCFHDHVNALQAAHRKEELKKEFWSLLEKSVDKPGVLLSEIYTQFLGKPCFTDLQENERQAVYDDYQRQLKHRLKIDFQELLWERPNVFRNLNLNQTLTEDDLNVIYNSLNDDQRFRKFHKLEDDRKVMLLNHVVFLQKSSVDRCFFHSSMAGDKCSCAECQVSYILRNERRLVPNGRAAPTQESNTSGPILRPLNLVLLGTDGLATNLVHEIRSMCIEDEYRVAHRVYSLDYRPIEGDVSEEQNSFLAPKFKPHGCVCVYNSAETLEYVRSSILAVLSAESVSEDENKAIASLPLVIMLAYEPYSVNELKYLREQGKVIARSLQCEFVDIPDEDLAEKLKFYPEQIEQALSCVIRGLGHSFIMEDTEPDLRILLCMMCADPFPMQIPVQPFLNENSFVVTSDPETSSLSPEEDNVFTIEAALEGGGGGKQRIEVTATSYHGGHLLCQRGEIYHGYILVYCPKRRASFASLKTFSDTIRGGGHVLVVAVPEGGGGNYSLNEHSQGLKDGKDLARNIGARFLHSSHNFQSQTAMQVYEKYLREVWDRRDEVDEDFVVVDETSPGPPAYNERPPAPLPTSPFIANKSTSSTSQSTEDSEPLYDQPHALIHAAQSDSERASSPSPPPLPSSSPPPPTPPTTGPGIGVPPGGIDFFRNDHELVKPSMLKEKRNQYAGREQYRKSFPAVEAEHYAGLRPALSQSMTEHLDVEGGGRGGQVPPQGQFRKSRSMKLAKDLEEAWAINEPKQRHSKSSTFPTPANRGSRLSDLQYDSTQSVDDDDNVWSPMSGRELYKPSQSKPKHKYNLPRKSGSDSPLTGSRVQAPLALPERIEISEVYGTPKDALYSQDSEYALVDDAMPHGKIQRIKSTTRKNEKGTDSEESECSSLERGRTGGGSGRRPGSHKKKHRHGVTGPPGGGEGPFVTLVNVRDPQQDRLQGTEHGEGRGRSNSPSEDSTGDELQSGRREKRRSLKKRVKSPQGGSSTNLSDSDIVNSSYGGSIYEDEDSGTHQEVPFHKVDDSEIDPNDSGNFGTWFRQKKRPQDPKALEKKSKDEERRRQRENEKKQKEQQKQQKKIRKKDSKSAAGGQSESGLSLADFSMSPNNPSVPQFIEKCVEFIEAEGLHAEGIYRIPGNKAQVDLLTSKYSEDSNVDISSLDIQVNAVATVLKAFFSDLADPLIPVAYYDELFDASEVVDKSNRISALRGVFLKMHPLNFEVLKFLITHLHKVSQNSEHNMMDSKNLSRCWWPTLMRMNFDSIDAMTKYSRIPEEILQTLIEQCSFFFHSGNEI